jgi:hypothetical protein
VGDGNGNTSYPVVYSWTVGDNIMTFEYPYEVIEAKVAERKVDKDRIKELEIALIATDDALFWLLNLLHGNSKGGPDFSPPNNAE